jgi:hypothetical protein
LTAAAEALRAPTIATQGRCASAASPRTVRIGGALSSLGQQRRIVGRIVEQVARPARFTAAISASIRSSGATR